MSNDQPAAGEGTEAKTENRPAAGISTGRIVTWVIIASLAVLTGLGAVAKFGYDGTLQALEDEAPSLPDGFVPSGLPPDPTSATTGGAGGGPSGPPVGQPSDGRKGSGSKQVLTVPDQPKESGSKKTPSKQ